MNQLLHLKPIWSVGINRAGWYKLWVASFEPVGSCVPIESSAAVGYIGSDGSIEPADPIDPTDSNDSSNAADLAEPIGPSGSIGQLG